MRWSVGVLVLLAAACTEDSTGLDGGRGADAGAVDGASDAGADGGSDRGADAGSRADAGPRADGGPGCVPDPRPEDGQPALDLGLACWTIQPGGRLDFDLQWASCCYFLEPYAGCETWWIDGGDDTITVDTNGTVRASADAVPGTVFRVMATLSTGERVGTAVTVVSDATHPVQGRFTERSRLGCIEPVLFTPSEPVREFSVCGDRFQATYTPFEVFVDFWGRFELDVATGDLRMVYEGGNTSSVGLDLEGRAQWRDGELLLFDMRLQAPRNGEDEACGHVFER